MDVIAELQHVSDSLDNIDKYNSSLSERLSIVEGKIQDLLHYVENNKISILWCYRYTFEMKKLRCERRQIKNDMEILSKYNEHKNKIISNDNRQFLMAELHKREKQLNMPYKNRQYQENEIESILRGKNNDK